MAELDIIWLRRAPRAVIYDYCAWPGIAIDDPAHDGRSGDEGPPVEHMPAMPHPDQRRAADRPRPGGMVSHHVHHRGGTR